MNTSENTEQKHGRNDNELTIFILAPSQQDPWVVTFSKTDKVSDVIQSVITKFGFSVNGKYELKLEHEPNISLKPERPLVSFGIKDHDRLVFIDFGQAV